MLSSGFLFETAGCQRAQEPVRVQWLTMGTVAAVQCADHAAAPQARDLAQTAFDELDRELSAWKNDSALASVNQAAGASPAVAVSPRFAKVLGCALDIANASDGAFNPLIGPVMRAWGFGGSAPRPSVPDADELNAARALSDWRKVEFAPTATGADVRLLMPGMRLDLGAIAKGYAVDLAWERLAQAGHTNLLVDLGGNLRAIGEAVPRRGGWRIGVRNPFKENEIIGFFLLRDGEAVATSGNYERFVEINGVRYAHIMDARTAAPVTGMAGTTVVAPSAMEADALSTAIFILGSHEGYELLSRHPGCEALWIPDSKPLTVIATPRLAARLKPTGGTPYALTVLSP
jgi:thiamine biosynthesis lipoprotein